MTRPHGPARGFVVALLGAESTGKTTLALELSAALVQRDPSRSVAVVPEYLREFCDEHGRTPRQSEQAMIAAEQTRRIAAAAAGHAIVIADTTALMIAVYSDQVFGDSSLYADAIAAQARCDLTLLTALDLPWRADGLQRDGPHVRAPVDAKVRAALARSHRDSGGYAVICGSGAERVAAALACIERALVADALPPARADAQGQGQRQAPGQAQGEAQGQAQAQVQGQGQGQAQTQPQPRWVWHCDTCGDADCERHLALLPRG